ncbi:uncharacterized protein LOC135951981 [Calliphora vicina]|uniref:uncharacterized protein LOC135951981 n=1 Tax=Calliphora vicina TaxID=7373 RepID=UPI00325AB230
MQHYVICAAANDASRITNSGSLDGGVTKGFRSRMRSPKIASIHILQAVPESLEKHPHNGQPAVAADNQTNILPPAGKFEIHSVSGEPNYKYVNLTWEVEFVQSDQDAITNSSAEVEPPRSFQVFFCEMQSFGPHRCRSKVVNGSNSLQMLDNTDNDLEVDKIRQVRQYMTQVDNLRMATKYSFHIRSTPKHKNMKVTGRSEIFDNEIEGEEFLSNNVDQGQTIVIPTKGFSAQATRCLPTASEIEVETGPHFGGKIVVDGGNCGIKGDPNDLKDKYVMRIDHKACGSMVKPETNTVETFITVQENLGIFTHSTRRFVVVCSYQSGLQTVRASFSVPGRGGASAVQQDHYDEEERMGRGLKPMRYVDKSGLVLKETDTDTTENNAVASEESPAMVEEMDNPAIYDNNSVENDALQATDDTTNAVATLENIIPGLNEEHIKQQTEVNENEDQNNNDQHEQHKESSSVATTNVNDDDDDDSKADESDMAADIDGEQFSAKFAKLTLELNDQPESVQEEDDSDDDFGATPTGRGFGSGFELISLNMGSVMLTVLLSVILIGVFIYVLYRETNLPPPMTQSSANASNRHHQQHHHQHQHLHEVDTLPRTLRTKNQDLLA